VAEQLADVFVSYKAEDRSRVAPLVRALEEEGFSVWWDTHIGGGAHWREDIQEHLDAAKCVIVIWTKRSVGHGGDFVRDEATRARKYGTYLPVRLDQVDPPLGFGELQAISLKGWRGDRSDGRFLTLSEAVRGYVTGEYSDGHHAQPDKSSFSRRTVIAGVAGTAALATVGVAGWQLLKPAPASATRIAVLPFANLSGDPSQAYFSDGIAEELRSALTRIGMQVIGRTSSDAVKDLDAKTVAAKLDVANILTGSVRRAPETIRVDAELVSGKDGLQKWAQTYDRVPGDAIKIQTDIAENVASALSIALGQAGRAALTLGGTSDSVAQDLFLKAQALRRQSDDKQASKTALDVLDAAIKRDPDYAEAYVEKSINLETLATEFPTSSEDGVMKLAQAERAARKAIAIAPGLGAGYAILSTIALVRLNLRQALAMARRALSESPNSPRVLKQTAFGFTYIGDAGEVLALLARGISLDPLDSSFYILRAQADFYSRRYDQAIDGAKKALLVAPDHQIPHAIIGDSLRELGRFADARASYRKLSEGSLLRIIGEAILAARTRDRTGATTRIGRLQQIAGDAVSYQIGQICSALGETDRAFAALDKAMEVKDPGLLTLQKDPVMDPIRTDPRFAALLKHLNFP